jgi:hypothetical protein
MRRGLAPRCAADKGSDVGKDSYYSASVAVKRRTAIGLKNLTPLAISERESRFVGDLLKTW